MAKLTNVKYPNEVVEIEGVQYRKVDREALAGDVVKITDEDVPGYVIDGGFYEVTRIDSHGDPQIADEDGDEFDLGCTDFDVYEKLAVGYREVKRKANPGERIRIVDRWSAADPYGNEAELTVKSRLDAFRVMAEFGGKDVIVNDKEYVVLEPVNRGEPAPQLERLTVGDYAKVIAATNGLVSRNEIVKIVAYDETAAPFRIESLSGEYRGWEYAESLVRATEAEVEAARKAVKIGEFVNGGYAVVVDPRKSVAMGGFLVGDYVEVAFNGDRVSVLSVRRKDGLVGYCNADALRKVTREEYEEATKPKPAFNVGDYAKVIADNFEHRVGHIVQITGDEPSYSEFDFAVKRITYGGDGYIAAKNIEKISAEEVARIEEEAKWAAIGRKVGEFRRGDFVAGEHREDGVVSGSVEYLGSELLGVRATSGSYYVVVRSTVKLIVPVGQRFDLSEGGADISK
ncbi:hypothetical protein [Paenibacillus campinasensis]|uniref:Uncharacterized protein n=1 Tax=Paenibacillus campinasensis TaxID=66347 RepID=A0A268EH18_9BACL|nr:hypothetical protein [Paenibacillus campinasensis]PAD72412.1 hypothetical protein CHH67_22490 [Paenibacillus campinasensis]